MPMPKSRTVPDLLDEIADRFPDREALVGGGRRFTYAQLQDEVVGLLTKYSVRTDNDSLAVINVGLEAIEPVGA